MQSVYGVACKAFTWPYGNKDDDELKQQAMQQVNTQAQAYATAANAKEAELANVNITKNIWPWFWGLMGQKCVEARGYAIPKGLSAQAEAEQKAQQEAQQEAKEANTKSCEGWQYIQGVDPSEESATSPESISKEDAKKALTAFQRDVKSNDPHTQACAYEGLGTLHQLGLGVSKNKAKALQFYEKEGKLGWGRGYGLMVGLVSDNQKKMDHYMDLCEKAPHKPKGDDRYSGCALAAGFGD